MAQGASAHSEHHTLPFRGALLSGWIMDPDRKKMSKSKGNVVTPAGLLTEHGSDAVRYWAARGRPGTDTAFDVTQMKIGRRLATKILNAARFVAGIPAPAAGAAPTEPVDKALIAELAHVTRQVTAALDELEYTRALEGAERFFWRLCDDYPELVKSRAYAEAGHSQEAADSARATPLSP